MVKTRGIGDERQVLVDDYAAASRAYCAAVERLRLAMHEGVEAFILAIDQSGTAHRTCERSRIQLQRHLAGRKP